MKNFKLNYLQPLFKSVLVGLIFLSFSCTGQGSNTRQKEVKSEKPSLGIHEATFMGNVTALKWYIDNKEGLDDKDQYGSTPLTIACTFGKTDLALMLINGGANINALSADGSTPLHTAAFFCRLEVVKALLDAGADTQVNNSYGSTALASVLAPFNQVKPIYDQLSTSLGPMGLKLDYEFLEKNRPVVAQMIQEKLN